jgi:predicted aminopeptidase
VGEVKRYAEEKYNMKRTDNYSTLYDQKGQDVLWNVTGCKPFSFEPYYWTFPIVGKASYKGFFDLDLAKKEQKRLIELGYDTRIRPVGAWSTLGWFKDPIMSKMLFRSEGDLIETIFHELTHTTIFVEDSIDFNENLASFVGYCATVEFLVDKYGVNSPNYQDFVDDHHDEQAYRIHFINGKEALDSLYKSFETDMSNSEKEELKNQLIAEIINNLDTVEFRSEYYYNLFDERPLPNNAYFMYFHRYYNMNNMLTTYFSLCENDLKRFLAMMIEMNS